MCTVTGNGFEFPLVFECDYYMFDEPPTQEPQKIFIDPIHNRQIKYTGRDML